MNELERTKYRETLDTEGQRRFDEREKELRALAQLAATPRESSRPIPMFLTCPKCNARHVDEGEFATKPHHTHSCQGCGLTWRPAIVPTVGVAFLPGFKNEPAAPMPSQAKDAEDAVMLLNATRAILGCTDPSAELVADAECVRQLAINFRGALSRLLESPNSEVRRAEAQGVLEGREYDPADKVSEVTHEVNEQAEGVVAAEARPPAPGQSSDSSGQSDDDRVGRILTSSGANYTRDMLALLADVRRETVEACVQIIDEERIRQGRHENAAGCLRAVDRIRALLFTSATGNDKKGKAT